MNQVAGIKDRLFAANMQSSSDKNGPKNEKLGKGLGHFLPFGVALWTHGHGEPWPAIATPFYTAVVAGHMAVEPAKGEPPMSGKVMPLNPH